MNGPTLLLFSMICLSLRIYDLSPLTCLTPSLCSNTVYGKCHHRPHSFFCGGACGGGSSFNPHSCTGNICGVSPFLQEGNWGSKSLSHSPKSHGEDLWPGPYSQPSPISPLSNHSLSKSQQLPPYPKQRTWSTYFSSQDSKPLANKNVCTSQVCLSFAIPGRKASWGFSVPIAIKVKGFLLKNDLLEELMLLQSMNFIHGFSATCHQLVNS